MVNDFQTVMLERLQTMLVETPAQTNHDLPRAPRPAGRLAGPPRVLAALTLGLLASCATAHFMTSGPLYKAHAIVGISVDAYAGLAGSSRVAADQSSAAAVLSSTTFARAAAALREKGILDSKPGLIDRLAVAIGFDDASSGAARIEQVLAGRVTAAPGPTAGTVSIEAGDDAADRASTMATAVAEAFIIDQDEAAAALRRASEASAAGRLRVLTEASEAARRRLASLGAGASDPAQSKADAAAATAAAKARLDAFKTVLASGTPPLGAQAGLPATIAPLQADYLELKRQLLDAKRTLGDLHTTVIGLDEGMRQSAKTLTAEWKRLTQAAEAEWTLARGREAALASTDTTRDPKTRQTIEDARDAAKAADHALAVFQANRVSASIDDRHFRLIAPASVPLSPAGWPVWLSMALSGLVGLAGAGGVILASRSAPRMREADRLDTSRPDAGAVEEGPAMDHAAADHDAVTTPHIRPLVEAMARSNRRFKAKPMTSKRTEMPSNVYRAAFEDDTIERRNPVHVPALNDVVQQLARLETRRGTLCTVLVGSDEPAAGTAAIVLELARAAAAAGRRVLLIEAARPRPLLASAVGLDARPILVDVLGMLRIAMRDDRADGLLYLAPTFPDARRLTAGLARRDDVPFIDEAATEFDLAIVDVGMAGGVAGEDWSGIADASIRVARHASKRDDDAFLKAIGGTRTTFIGTIARSNVAAAGEAPNADIDAPITPRPRLVAFRQEAATSPQRIPSQVAPSLRNPVRRKIGAR